MGWLTPEQAYWIIQPLVRAGLDLDEIGDLVFRLGFAGIVSEGRDTPATVIDLVADQPLAIRTAWAQAVGRMIGPDAPASAE